MKLKYVFFILWLIPLWGYADDDLPMVDSGITTPIVQSNPSSVKLIAPLDGVSVQSLLFNVQCIGEDNDGVKRLDIVFIDKNGKQVIREGEYRSGVATPLECLSGVAPYSLGLAEGELTIQIKVIDGKGNEEIPTANNFAKINWSMPLNLNITQPQNGSIVGTIGNTNINCGNGNYSCYAGNQLFTNVDFTLTPVPNDGFKFDGWTGACSSMPCKLTAHDNTLSASFSAKQLPNQPPTANFTLNPITGTAPLTVSVTQNSSSDPDGSIAKYEWKTSDNQTSTAITPSFTFASAGEYNVTLTVTDDKGAVTNSAAQKVTVSAPTTTTPPVAQIPNATEYQFVAKWDSVVNSEFGIFGLPHSIAVGNNGNIYVAGQNELYIQKVNGQFSLVKWNTGDAHGGIAVDAHGNIYITDIQGYIQKFDGEGNLISKWSSKVVGDTQFQHLGNISVDSSGNVYVVDKQNASIKKFDSNGQFLIKWGSLGNGDGQFGKSSSTYTDIHIAVDSNGNVYVSDFYNHRIQKFDSNGKFLSKWGSNGVNNGQFSSPLGVAADIDGYVYVSDAYQAIQKFDGNGQFITKFGTTGYERKDGEFRNPYGIAVDRTGNVYIADRDNYRIQKFAPTAATPIPTTNLSNGLIAHYCFDDASNLGKDCSNNNNLGKVYGLLNVAQGIVGSSANFLNQVVQNGSGAHIDVPKPNSIEFTKEISVSYFLKIKNEKGEPFSSEIYLGKSPNTASGFRIQSFIYGGELKSQFGVNAYLSGAGIGAGQNYSVRPDWIHVVVAFSKETNLSQIYIDGELVKQAVQSSIDFTETNVSDFAISAFASGADATTTVNVLLDEVKIFNRVLSSAEVKQLSPIQTIGTANQAPTAKFTATPEQGTVPLAITLDASTSTDPEGKALTYEWTSQPAVTIPAEKAPKLTLSQAGTYTFSLTVKDDKGLASAPISKTVTVAEIPKVVLTVTPPTNGEITATNITCGTTVCKADYPLNTPITLTAKPAANFVVDSWTGCVASADKQTCDVKMDSAKTVSVTFKSLVTPPSEQPPSLSPQCADYRAEYSSKTKTLTLPVVALPSVTSLTNILTGKTELLKVTMKLISQSETQFRVLTSEIITGTIQLKPECPVPTYVIAEERAYIPEVAIPTFVTLGGKTIETDRVFYQVTLKWLSSIKTRSLFEIETATALQ